MCAKKKSFAFSNISSVIIAPQGLQNGLLAGPQLEQRGATAKRQVDIALLELVRCNVNSGTNKRSVPINVQQ